MPTTPRFHRRKNSRGNSSPSTWLSHLRVPRPSSRSNTPTRRNASSDHHRGISDEESSGRPGGLRRQLPVIRVPSSPLPLSGQQPRERQPLPPPPPVTATTTTDEPPQVDSATSWTDPEQLFFSQDDDSVTVGESDDEVDSDASSTAVAADNDTAAYFSVPYTNFSSLSPLFPDANSFVSPASLAFSPHPNPLDATAPQDDETCNNTITEKVKQRSKKAVRASTVGAFNTFLKALFGIGMLSNPAVLGEVGLLLGTICHLFIILGCAFACYLLLTARQLAVNEVRAREKKEQEDVDEYHEFVRRRKVMMENTSALQQQQHQQQNQMLLMQQQQQQQQKQQQPQSSLQVLPQLQLPYNAPLRQPLSAPLTTSTPDGWGRCRDSMIQAGEVLSPTSNCVEGCTGGDPPPPPLIDDDSNTPPRSMPPQFSNPVMHGSSNPVPPSSLQEKTTPRRNRSSPQVSNNAYHRWDDYAKHASSGSLTKLSNATLMAPPKKSKQVRLVTYGDVAKYLAGPSFAQFMIFTIVGVHLMFASGMLHIAVENLCYIAGWDRLGFSYTDVMVTGADDFYGDKYYGSQRRRLGPSQDGGGSHSSDHNSRDEHQSRDQEWRNINIEEAAEEYSKWEGPDFVGRIAMSSLLFPIIHGLLQIPSLKELATISTMGLVTYALGCVGSMLYSAFVLTEGQPFLDRPDDLFQVKWSGIPTYVATTIYAIEGINLALPTVNTLEGSDRGGRVSNLLKRRGSKENDKEGASIKLVVTAVFCYGCVTLFVSWIGLAGGLGGGLGTLHEQEGCRDVTYCLNSVKIQYVYMLSLGVALVLTLPVILYPSTEMLEIWLDERADEKRRKLEAEAEANNVPNYEDMTTKQLKLIRRHILEAEAEANNIPNPHNMTTKQLKAVRRHIRSKSLMDDETIGHLDMHRDQNNNDNIAIPPTPSNVYIEMKSMRTRSDSPGTYSPPRCSPKCNQPDVSVENVDAKSSVANSNAAAERHERKIKAKRKLKYWKLRMFLAFLICFIGTLEGSYPQLLKAAEVIRGVGLSMAGLISPPLLYMSAVGGRFSAGMASAMALLIGLGLFNIVLVLMSAFGGKDYIIEEGPGRYHDSFYELDDQYFA
ncbi:hypothetical protein HJC23_002396 [Cyclotella cryptica]|uniref:Amino acid transporter transmembrane domain-containing protein n=1 Tax=Cyclotella cryptica TaxID=29204 RepID=A0ABD3QM13_9STRA|eukprot:CCRYP_004502-RA/>CCRYP_004502-RA protein AED:0.09 eAED:0.09 QI:0/-1/0/1/-1/1/1/0/1105